MMPSTIESSIASSSGVAATTSSSSPSLSTGASSPSSLSPLSITDTPTYFGISPPISYAQPTDEDICMNNDLDAYLKRRGDVYEEIEGHIKRNNVIDKLSSIVRSWATDISKIKGIDIDNIINGEGIQLKIFGSTRLGVHTPDADIDVLCIAPSYVTRADFFTSFCTLMISRTDVSMLSAIPEAYTPVVKFNIDGQAIDMIFVSLPQKPVISPTLDVLDVTNLYGLDEQGVRSLNGPRVADAICKLVPNFDSFCTALRFLKHWARQRGLYSNVLGFLGGVNYAILVAFISQRYPNACPATIVSKFFNMYSQWRWPMPVMLNTIEDHNPQETGSRYLPVWNPKLYPKDGAQLMPIITPAYPAMNSAYNVGLPQFRMILHEILRGQLMFQNHRRGDALWEKLCQPVISDFFDLYPRYVQIDISAKNADDHRSWFGWCESRLRQLILSLEQPPYMFCHPTANCFHRCLVPTDDDNDNSNENTSFISSFFIGLTFTKSVGTMDITPSIQDFIYRVTCWIGKKEGMEVNVSVFEQSQAPDFVFETKAEPSNIRGCTPAKKATANKGRSKRDLNGNNDYNDNENNDDLYNGPSADFASYFEGQEGELSPVRTKKTKTKGETKTDSNDISNNIDNDSDPATDSSSITRCKSPEIETRSWSAAVRNGHMMNNTNTIIKTQSNSTTTTTTINTSTNNNANTNSKNEYKNDGNHNNKKGRGNGKQHQHFPSANRSERHTVYIAQAKENSNNKDTCLSNNNNNSSNNSSNSNNTKTKSNTNSNAHANNSKGNSSNNSQQKCRV